MSIVQHKVFSYKRHGRRLAALSRNYILQVKIKIVYGISHLKVSIKDPSQSYRESRLKHKRDTNLTNRGIVSFKSDYKNKKEAD